MKGTGHSSRVYSVQTKIREGLNKGHRPGGNQIGGNQIGGNQVGGNQVGGGNLAELFGAPNWCINTLKHNRRATIESTDPDSMAARH